ncbi:carboxypeptidase Y [Coprinopsis cinerea AmutBmut pab1-1]|nr:carboxypeptidase Y [Coprinopsis cinerea AmutBmut pab1-1]
MRYLTRALTSIVLASFSVNAWAFRPGDGGGYRQELLHPNLGFPTLYNDGLFTPFEDLSTLSETDFTTLTHPAFPRHSVRVKQTKFCDNTVRAYTGYIDIGPRHLFFYFFESRSRPNKDPVVLWTNGGPGCSSSLAALLEHGIKVLIYVGVNDWICNYIGNSRWVSDLDWSGREGYGNAVTRDWYTSASFTENSKRKLVKAGTVREYGGLTFLTIDGAGHMAPYDKPEELLDMASRWFDGRKFT